MSQSFYPHKGGVTTHLMTLAKKMAKLDVGKFIFLTVKTENDSVTESIYDMNIFRVNINKKVLDEYYFFKEILYNLCHGLENGKNFDKIKDNNYAYEEFNKIMGQHLLRLNKKESFDLIHIHDFQLLPIYKYIKPFLSNSIPLLFSWYIPIVSNLPQEYKEYIIDCLIQYDKVTFLSNEFKNIAIDMGLPAKKAERLFPLTDTNYYKPDDNNFKFKQKYNIEADKNIILCAQRFDAKSGQEQIVSAMPKILKQVPNVVLFLAYVDSLSNKLSDNRKKYKEETISLIKKLNLSKQVLLVGNLNKKSLYQAYNASSVLVLLSKNEGFGLTITEAMSCSKPVVATNVGGIKEQIEDKVNGYLVEVGDVSSTAERIIDILTNESLAKDMGIQALNTVRKKFAAENLFLQYFNLYDNMLK